MQNLPTLTGQEIGTRGLNRADLPALSHPPTLTHHQTCTCQRGPGPQDTGDRADPSAHPRVSWQVGLSSYPLTCRIKGEVEYELYNQTLFDGWRLGLSLRRIKLVSKLFAVQGYSHPPVC